MYKSGLQINTNLITVKRNFPCTDILYVFINIHQNLSLTKTNPFN